LAGGRDYSPEEAQRYARQFGVTAEWLLTGYRQMADDKGEGSDRLEASTPTKSRISGYIGRGGQLHFYAVAPEDLDEIEVPKLATESTVALEIRGKSMGAHFNHWFLLYDDLRRRPTPELVGALCVVALQDGRILIKQLQQGRAEGQFDLISPAGPSIRDASIVWAANIKGMIQR
jgi:hypothetical protein